MLHILPLCGVLLFYKGPDIQEKKKTEQKIALPISVSEFLPFNYFFQTIRLHAITD